VQVLKWTYLTDDVATLDEEPSILLFGQQHTEIFPFALMILPVYVLPPPLFTLSKVALRGTKQ